MTATRTIRWLAPALIATLMTACGGSSDAGPQTARAPKSAGDVWEIEGTTDRTTASTAVMAYVNGLHVFVLDGDDAFVGMTRVRGTRSDDGSRRFQIADSVSVELAPAGDLLEMRFASGERIPVRKRSTAR